MGRALLAFGVPAVCPVLAGCASGHQIPGPVASIVVPQQNPPSPATWPAYPKLSKHSCWGRPSDKGAPIERSAPSFGMRPTEPMASIEPPIAPRLIARRLLARLGDHRYIRSIDLTPAPPATGGRLRSYYAGARPPRGALWATIDAPAAKLLQGHPAPTQVVRENAAYWEGMLVGGALRDDLCAAGRQPLVGWTVTGGQGGGFSESWEAFNQRFPNPPPQAFRKRVELVGRRYGFRVQSLRLIRPLQLAPLLIVKTSRDRTSFVKDLPAILSLLNPNTRNAATFEGFFFEAEDSHGPFVETSSGVRGQGWGGQWSWNPSVYPFSHG
jgi:hypothetical protein